MKNIISFAISSILSLCVIVGGYFAIVQIGYDSLIFLILAIVAGYFLTVMLYIFVHELGHLIGGFVGGFKFYSFNVLFFKFIMISGKLKLRLSFSKGIAGYCQMIPTKTENLNSSFTTYVRGSLISSTAFLAVAFAFAFLPLVFPDMFNSSNVLVYAFFLPTFVACISMHMSNFSKFSNIPSSDGAILRGIKENSVSAQMQIKMIAIQTQLFSGTRPRDLDMKLFEDLDFSSDNAMFEPLFASYEFSHYLDCRDIENVIKTSDKIKSCYKNSIEVFHSLLLCDVFYTELVYKNDIDEAKRFLYRIAKLLKGQTDIATLRIRMAKELFIDGAYSQALNTAVVAKNLADSYEVVGARDMECEILDELSAIARNKKTEQLKNADINFVSYID